MLLKQEFAKETVGIIIQSTIDGFGNGSPAPTKEGARDISPKAPRDEFII